MERIQTLLNAGELEEAVLAFLREIVRMPPHELEPYRKLAAFVAGRGGPQNSTGVPGSGRLSP